MSRRVPDRRAGQKRQHVRGPWTHARPRQMMTHLRRCVIICRTQRWRGSQRCLSRLACNLAWMKVDPLWVAIVRSGLMPFATRILERVLRLPTRPAPQPAWTPSTGGLPAEPLAGEHAV